MSRPFGWLASAFVLVLAASVAPLVTAHETSDPEITKPPSVVHQVVPEMPPSARADRIGGQVILRVTVTTAGEPRDITVEQGIEGHPEFEEAAAEALAQWTFTPAESNGELVEMQILVPFLFKHDH